MDTQLHSGNLRRGRVSQPGQIYLVTACTRQREPIFRNFRNATAACASFTDSARAANCNLLAWVLMPDHAHWIVQLGEGYSLSQGVMRLKGRSAAAANRTAGGRACVWQPGFHDHAVRDERQVRDIARYVVANPLRAGLVDSIGDYPYWDACWL